MRKAVLPVLSPDEMALACVAAATAFWRQSFTTTSRYFINKFPEPESVIPDEEIPKVPDLVQQGLQWIDQALVLNPTHADAWPYKVALLQELAKVQTDPAMRQVIMKQADKARDRSIELKLGELVDLSTEAERLRSLGLKYPIRENVAMAALQKIAVKKVNPIYPPMAREARVSGSVEVEVVIDENGEVVDCRWFLAIPCESRPRSRQPGSGDSSRVKRTSGRRSGSERSYSISDYEGLLVDLRFSGVSRGLLCRSPLMGLYPFT